MLAHCLSLLVVLGYAMCLNYNILEPYANSKFYPTANAQIKWRLDNVSLPFPNPDIRIHLYNEKQKFLMEIDSFVGNTGLYEWTIPSDLMYSAHYQGLRVCIDSVTPGDIEGCSEVFYLQSYLEEPRQLDLSVEGIEAATVYVEEELNTKFSKLSSFPELPWGVSFEMHVPSKGAEAHVGKSVTLARNVSFGNSYEGNVKLKVPTLEQWGNIPKDKNAGDDSFDAELFAYGYNTKKGSLVYGSLPVRVAYQIPLKLRFISVDPTTVWETDKVQSIVMGLCAQDDDSVVRNRDIRLSMWFVNDKNEKVGDVLVNKEVFRHEMTSGVFSIKFTLKNDSIVWKALESASSFSGDDQKVFTQEVKVADKKVRLVYNAEYNVNINNGKSHDRWIKLEGHSEQFFLKFNQKQKSSAGHLAPSFVSYAVSTACVLGVFMFHAFGFPTKLAVRTTAFISSVAAIHALNSNLQYRKLKCHFWNSAAASEHEINCPSKIRSLAKTSIKSTVSIETSVEFSIRTGLFGFRKAETQVAISKGTGFILSKDKGLVVTNAHVIQDIVGQKEGQFELSIKLWDGSWFEGKVVAFDAWSDLAVLQIEGYDEKYIDFDVEEVKFGNSDTVEIGDWLYTFGDPLGLGHSLTSGIASSLHRQNADVDMSGRMDSRLEYIQTNFSGLDYGNSGGPVFNLKGELVAILCIKAATGGIGFALTSNSTRALIDQLVQSGKVIRPWLGLRLVSVTKAVRQTLKLPETVPRGVLVTDVFKDSPAYKAQLKEGDVIHRLNGQPIDNTNDVFALIKYSPEPFIVSVVRQVDSQWKEYELQVLPEELDVFHQARIPLNSGGIDEYEDYISSLRPDQQSSLHIVLFMMIAISNFGSTILLLLLFAQNCLSFSPEKCPGYKVESVEQTACSFMLKLRLAQSESEISPECSYYGSDYSQLLAEVVAETENRVKLVVKDVEEKRWVVPNSVLPRPEYSCSSGSLSNVKIQHAKVGEAFKLQIFRAGSDEALIDVSDNLVFKEQLIHLTSRVPRGANIYGLGETVSSFRRNENNTRNAIWTRDWPTPLNENGYGAHPSYVEIRNGKAHGVILVNSNGMDVILSEVKVSWNVIGGIFEFYVLLGPSPTEVTKQITDVIGRPAMMPLWSLGFHQCKWGYQNIWEVEEVVKQYRQNNIPLEAMWVDIDYMDGYRDFTYDPKKFPVPVVSRLQEHLKKNHQRFVAIVDPGIKIDRGYDAYDSGLKEDLFIKIDGKPFKGKVWPDWTNFPDWFHSSTAEWWKDQIEKWYKFVDLDGLWIDMNEVANFCDGDCDGKTGPRSGFEKFKGVGKLAKDFDPNNPKYKIDNGAKELALNSRTTPMDATHGDNSDILDYFVHNLYGHMESQVTFSALKQLKPHERPFVLTRSSFLGTGKYAAHWLGDNHSTWESMLYSLSELLKFNGIFGISMIGSDICGFLGNTNEELCTRWTQLGALIYPFARNHNALGNTAQEPYLFQNVKKAMEKYVYGIRYEFLPYWYTLFHLSSTYGETHVTRSLAWEFPHDNNVLDIFRQVLVGPGLLVTPVFEAGSTSVRGYLPEGVWFELESGKPIISSGSWYDFSAPLDFIPIHMRGSNIFAHVVKPLEGLTTTEIFEAGRIGFTVAASLGEKVAYDGSLALARGKLYMDEGAGLKLSTSFTNIDEISGLEVNMTLAMITLKKKKIRFPCKSRGECTAPIYTFSLKLDFKKTGPWESEISKAPTMDLVKILGVRHVLEQIDRQQHAQLVFQNGRIADDHDEYVNEEFKPYALYHVNTPNQPAVRSNDDYSNLLLVWDKNQGVKLDGSNNEIFMEVVGNY